MIEAMQVHREPEFQFPDLALGQVVAGIVKLQQENATLKLQKSNLQEKLRKESDDHCNQHIQWRNFENGYEKTIRELEEQVGNLERDRALQADTLNNLRTRLIELEQVNAELAEAATKHQEAIEQERHEKKRIYENLMGQKDERYLECFRQFEMSEKRCLWLEKELKNAKKGTPKKKTRKVRKDKVTKVSAENP